MKKITKKSLKSLVATTVLLLMSMSLGLMTVATFISCEKEDPIPPCQQNKVGKVIVKNSTGYNVWVDVTWGDVVENYEKLLYNGNSFPYENVPAAGHVQSNGGTIEIWVSFDGQDWYYEYENLSPCEEMTFTWYLNARKSASDCPIVVYGPNGDEIDLTPGDEHPTKTKTWDLI